MAISLQDQLLKAGLASKQQANKVKADKRKNKKKASKQSELTLQNQTVIQSRQEKQERDRQLNLQREQDKAQKASEAEAKQLIEVHKVKKDPEAEVSYRFVDGKLVKTLYVTPQQQDLLARGRLVICKCDEQYHMVPSDIADRIEQRQPTWLFRVKSEEIREDDPYAAYQIPDDLMW